MSLLLPPYQHFGTEDFAYWEDFLTEEEISQLLSLKEWSNKSNGLVGVGNDELKNSYNPEIRNSEISWLKHTNETDIIWCKILNTITEVNRRFFHFDLSGCFEDAQLTYYSHENKQHYSWHKDSGSNSFIPRKLSMTLLLNDPEEFKGGDFQLMTDSDTPVTVEQKKGRAWFFPSYTLHRVTPVTEGERKSLVLWIGGPAFR
jgi:PKHD-type hydroxylase